MINGTPTASAKHWATALIGKPWRLRAEGPDEFDCWGLVRWIMLNQYGIQMPEVDIDVRDTRPEQWRMLRELVQRSGWFTVEYPAQGDVVLMRCTREPHVGVMVRADGKLGVLHAHGLVVDGVHTGSVKFDVIDSLKRIGYGHFEFWRHE